MPGPVLGGGSPLFEAARLGLDVIGFDTNAMARWIVERELEVLLLLRKQRGHTQEDLAHAAGLTVTAYARIERGSANSTWTTVRRIAKALDVTLARPSG